MGFPFWTVSKNACYIRFVDLRKVCLFSFAERCDEKSGERVEILNLGILKDYVAHRSAKSFDEDN